MLAQLRQCVGNRIEIEMPTGFLCYGAEVLAPDFPPELRTTIHGVDERIDINSLHCFTSFFFHLAQQYLS